MQPLREELTTGTSLALMAFLQAPVAVILCDNDSTITLVNEHARQISRGQPEGNSMKSAANIWGRIINYDGTPKEWPSAESLQAEVNGRECRLVSASGEIREVLFITAPILASNGSSLGAVVIFADVSNNKRLELVRLDQAIAAERTRIAENIHDNVSQSLNATILEIRAANEGLTQSAKVASVHLRRTLRLALNSLAEARRATSILSENVDTNQAPGVVLRRLASELFYGSGIELAFHLQEPIPLLPPHLTRELVRFGKEALRNARRHANASKVLTSFSCDASSAVLKVADNGTGFVRTPSKGFGLLCMQARAERLGGTLHILSSAEQGTAITLTVPLSSLCPVTG